MMGMRSFWSETVEVEGFAQAEAPPPDDAPVPPVPEVAPVPPVPVPPVPVPPVPVPDIVPVPELAPLPPEPPLLPQATPTAREAKVAKKRIFEVTRCMKTVLSP
jgi:hypothetical protein